MSMAHPLLLCPNQSCDSMLSTSMYGDSRLTAGGVLFPERPWIDSPEHPPMPILSIASLAEFTSTMVYLLWHARRPCVLALDTASSSRSCLLDDNDFRETSMIANATSAAFKTFCSQVLMATQASEAVVLLSLKYIARLLRHCPSIQGAQGSEFRLFIVSLILASKFQEDTTLTSRTWAAVSGMRMSELKVMELEFLAVLGFQLHVPKHEFDQWRWGLLTLHEQLVFAQPATVASTALKRTGPPWQAPGQLTSLLPFQWQALYDTQPLSRPASRVPMNDLLYSRSSVPAPPVPLMPPVQDFFFPSDDFPITPVSWDTFYPMDVPFDGHWACCQMPPPLGI